MPAQSGFLMPFEPRLLELDRKTRADVTELWFEYYAMYVDSYRAALSLARYNLSRPMAEQAEYRAQVARTKAERDACTPWAIYLEYAGITTGAFA